MTQSEQKTIEHPRRCEMCDNKKEIRTNDRGERPFSGDITLFLGYKCKITGLWCDEKYEHTQQINQVGCVSYVPSVDKKIVSTTSQPDTIFLFNQFIDTHPSFMKTWSLQQRHAFRRLCDNVKIKEFFDNFLQWYREGGE